MPSPDREAWPPQIGVAIQYNPEISWFPFEDQEIDAYEILLDTLVGALDSPYVILRDSIEGIAALRARATLLAHSNYGADFGFLPLEETAAVRLHVPAAQLIEAPWVSNHGFYADNSRSDTWSCPVQFSHAEVSRVAARAKTLQAIYGIPLLHENAAYYLETPGAEMPEAEFMARLVEAAGTYLHLDLHNIYTNSVNLKGFDCRAYLDTIPLDRVVAIHLAGGRYSRGTYHDWHDSSVPEPVWEMLEQVLQATRVGAVIVEYQGRGHHDDTPILEKNRDLEMIVNDLERAKSVWDRIYGPGSRRSTARADTSDDDSVGRGANSSSQ
jgi:uncharacterized protein (UPF0276 family)